MILIVANISRGLPTFSKDPGGPEESFLALSKEVHKEVERSKRKWKKAQQLHVSQKLYFKINYTTQRCWASQPERPFKRMKMKPAFSTPEIERNLNLGRTNMTSDRKNTASAVQHLPASKVQWHHPPEANSRWSEV